MEISEQFAYNINMFAIYPEIINFARERNCESLAVAVRKYFGSQSPKIKLDIDELARELGLTIHSSSHVKIGAVVTSDKKGVISSHLFLNEEYQAPHRFSDLLQAHLLGHFFLHMLPVLAVGEGRVPNYQELIHPIDRLKADIDTSEGDTIREKEADDFALALLLPIGMFRRALNHFKTVDKTATFFGCSVDIVRIRALRLRMILPDQLPITVSIQSKKAGLARIREIAQKLDR